jgi:hypothetical protein
MLCNGLEGPFGGEPQNIAAILGQGLFTLLFDLDGLGFIVSHILSLRYLVYFKRFIIMQIGNSSRLN